MDTLEEQQASALGNIAQPDAYIQFFAARKRSEVFGHTTYAPKRACLNVLSAVFGTVPSTIDKLPQVLPSEDGKTKPKLMHYPQHFGAMSETGLFLSYEELNRKGAIVAVKTKIDLPYSYVFEK